MVRLRDPSIVSPSLAGVCSLGGVITNTVQDRLVRGERWAGTPWPLLAEAVMPVSRVFFGHRCTVSLPPLGGDGGVTDQTFLLTGRKYLLITRT